MYEYQIPGHRPYVYGKQQDIGHDEKYGAKAGEAGEAGQPGCFFLKPERQPEKYPVRQRRGGRQGFGDVSHV